MVFNYAALELLNAISCNELNDYPLHDHWLSLVVSACGGKIIYDRNAYIFYRQHGDNVIGADRSIISKIKDNGLFNKENRRYKIAMELKHYYKELFCKETLRIIDLVENYPSGIKEKIELFNALKSRIPTLIERELLMVLILLNKF